MFNLINIISFIAFVLVLIGLRGIKFHIRYGQKCMLVAQICWFSVGWISNNYVLMAQSMYLTWYTWTIHRYWNKEGYYDF